MVYLITFSCYGAHLRGQPGTYDRVRRPSKRGGPCPESEGLVRYATRIMSQKPYLLDAESAQVVLRSIQGNCEHHNWKLYAAHVRTNHVHTVVGNVAIPNRAMQAFKAYATRELAKHDEHADRRHWARHGSIVPLRTPESLQAAIHYVVAHQGPPIALYDPFFQSTAFTSPTMNK